MIYRAEIDGLRAVAVVPVVLFHSGIAGFAGGFVGVDVFFVISGYLITKIILQDLAGGRFSIASFYERRARRLLPALLVVLISCLPFAWAWMLPQELAAFGRSLIATALFGSNILFWSESGYFDHATELKPLLHTWSLAIEEQYYLFFPVMLAFVWRWRRSAVLPALLFVILASLAMAEWGWRNKPSANFYFLPSRLWELLIGAVFAVRFGNDEWRSETLSLLGLGMILVAMFLFDAATPMPSFWTLLPVAGTALVLGFGRSGTIVARLLSLKPLVGIGLISYSAYLWHQPLLAFARIRNVAAPEGALLWGLLVATLLLAWVTWRFVERSFRGAAPRLPRRGQVGVASFASVALVAMIGTALAVGNGFSSRLAPSGDPFNSVTNLDAMLAPNFGLHSDCDAGYFTTSANCRTSVSPTMALWGDSFAMHLAQALESSATALPFIQFTLSQCGPVPGLALNGSVTTWQTCIEFNDNVLKWVLSDASLKIVVISSPFDQLKSDLYTRDGTVITNAVDRKESVAEALLQLARQLAAVGKRLVIVSPPPRTGQDLALCYVRSRLMHSGGDGVCDFSATKHRSFSAKSIELLRAVEDSIPIIWLDELICNAGRCSVTYEGEPLYRDSGHLSVPGSARFGASIDLAAIVLAAANAGPVTAP